MFLLGQMMLKVFRQKYVTKIVLWAILILILPAFVIWGTGGMGRSRDKGPTYAGLIKNKKVSFDEFAESISAVKCQLVLNYFNQPKALEIFLKNKPFLGKLAWDRLIMVKEAIAYKMRASDKEVVKCIRSHPLFLRSGGFDERMYGYVLRNNLNLDARTFEEIMRQNLAVQKLQNLLTKDIKTSDSEALENYKSENEKFKISYILFPVSDFTAQVTISEAELKNYYEEYHEEFLLPAKEGEARDEPAGIAKFEDVKESIKSLLSEKEAGKLAAKKSEDTDEKIKELVGKDKESFESAAAKLELKVDTTILFSRTDYLEGIGEAANIADVCAKLKNDEISSSVKARKGSLIFKVAEAQGFDEERFKKEKDKYYKNVIDKKKDRFLEDWLRGLELSSTLNIDLKDYEKYYR